MRMVINEIVSMTLPADDEFDAVRERKRGNGIGLKMEKRPLNECQSHVILINVDENK